MTGYKTEYMIPTLFKFIEFKTQRVKLWNSINPGTLSQPDTNMKISTKLYYYKTLEIKTKESIAKQLLALNYGIKTQMKQTILELTESGSWILPNVSLEIEFLQISWLDLDLVVT